MTQAGSTPAGRDLAALSVSLLQERVRTASAGRPVVARAPGRVNLLGGHTDYNHGFVLPAATSQGTYVAALPSFDGLYRVWSQAFEGQEVFEAEQFEQPSETKTWGSYVRGVLWALRQADIDPVPFDAVIVGDVPIGSGLASSAALEVATTLAALALAETHLDPKRTALLCQKAENEFVGVQCGVLDQFSSVFGREDSALLIDCRSLQVTAIPMGRTDLALVVCDTAKPRGLVESEYNARRAQCERAARQLGVPALRDVTLEQLTRRRGDLGEVVYRRARHVVTENQRVLEGVHALRSGHLAELGELLTQAHASLRDDYEVSCPELDTMVQIACGTEGCYGARLMGAGFGGCVLAVVAAEAAQGFCELVEGRYRAQTGREGKTFITRPSQGAGLADQASGNAT